MSVRLGPYALQQSIGRGAGGVVWAAVHEPSGTGVALKVMTVAATDETRPVGAASWGQRELRAFRNEVRAVAALDHPGIVAVYDHGLVPEGHSFPAGNPYLVMERCHGTIRDRFDRLTWPDLARLVAQLLDALAHAHARGVIHRDVKPNNVLLDRQGRARLADFGLAHARDARSVVDLDGLESAGTPRYMPPEQILGRWREFGPWTDLYALGSLAWRMVTGRAPFARALPDQTMAATLHDDLPPFTPRFEVPDGVEAWLRRMLTRVPHLRFARAADALLALQRVEQGPAPPPPRGLMPTLASLVGLARQPEPSHTPAPPPDWRSTPEPAPRAPPGVGLGLFSLRTPRMVGRRAERTALWELTRAVHRHGGLRAVLLRGPTGVGKSRLARWLCERAHETGTGTPLHAVHALGGGVQTGLGPMVLRHFQAVGLTGSDLRAHLRDQLYGHVPTLPSDEVELETEALVHLTTPAPSDPTQPAERYSTLARLLVRESQARVAVVWLDDLQWSIDAVGLWEHLVHRADQLGGRILLVGTLRDDTHGAAMADAVLEPLSDHPATVVMAMSDLPGPDAVRLARGMGLGPDLAVRVAERTAGNPLFTVQLVRDWVRRDLLVPSASGFQLTGGDTPLPDDVHAVWVARVARALRDHPDQDGHALELAAISGHQIDPELWADACRRSGLEPPTQLVDELLEQGMLRALPGGAWAFAHAMLRESLERRAVINDRAAGHHRSCADAVWARAGRRLDTIDTDALVRLARHFIGCGEPARALDPLIAAANRHVQVGERRAMALRLEEWEQAVQAAGLPDDDIRRAPGLDLEVVVRLVRRDRHAAKRARAFLAAVEANGWDSWRPAALHRLAQVAHHQGDLARARELASEAESLYGDDLRGRWRAAQELTDVLARMGQSAEARAAGERAIAYAEQSGDPYKLCRSHDGLAHAAFAASDLDRAEAEGRAALELATTHGYLAIRALTQLLLGEVARYRGQADMAESRYRVAEMTLAQLGHPARVFARANLGLLLLDLGRYHEAEPVLVACLALPELEGWHVLTAPLSLALACCHVARGELGSWEQLVGRAREAITRSGNVDPDLARLLERAGDLVARARPAYAAASWSLALDQLKKLGRDEDAARVRSKLGGPASARPTSTG